MRFIHTADWQIGMSFKCAPDKGEALRQARVDVVKQIIALAEKEHVDFIIAAGDLFDKNMLEPAIVENIASIVSRSTVPIYMLPGNHDPLMLNSPYERTPDLFKDSAIVLRADKPIKVDGGTLYPCPAKSRRSSVDPTTWIPGREADDGIRVGIAHGSINSPAGDDFPIAGNAATVKELDYLALGHWHGMKMIDERTWYCGAPESTTFGQPNAGMVLIVDISARGAVPKVRPVEVARFKWRDVEKEVHSAEDVAALIDELNAMVTPETLLKIKISGSLAQPQLDLIENFACERCFHIVKSIDVALDPGTWNYKHSLLKGVAELLTADTALSGEEGAAARRALSKLNLLVRHAGFRGEGQNDAH